MAITQGFAVRIGFTPETEAKLDAARDLALGRIEALTPDEDGIDGPKVVEALQKVVLGVPLLGFRTVKDENSRRKPQACGRRCS